jgi:hypothetical protein
LRRQGSSSTCGLGGVNPHSAKPQTRQSKSSEIHNQDAENTQSSCSVARVVGQTVRHVLIIWAGRHVLACPDLKYDLLDHQYMSSRTVIATTLRAPQRSYSADMHLLESGTCMKDSKHSAHRLSSKCSFLFEAKLRLGSSGAHPCLLKSSWRDQSLPTPQ